MQVIMKSLNRLKPKASCCEAENNEIAGDLKKIAKVETVEVKISIAM